MSFGARALIAACALGGGSVPWLLRQFNTENSTISSGSSSAITSDHSSLPPTSELKSGKPDHAPTGSHLQPKKVNAENCSVARELVDLESLLWYSNSGFVDLDTFIRVTCSNANLNQDSKMPNQWSGLFPNTLFKDRQEVTEGRKIGIKVKTEAIEDSTKYKTTFSGSHFYDQITGEWVKENLDETGEKVTEVKIISSGSQGEKIYLLFKQ